MVERLWRKPSFTKRSPSPTFSDSMAPSNNFPSIVAVLVLVLGAFASSAIGQTRDPRYPKHWWTPVATEGKPDWEILPQEAGPGEVILSKRHELGLLSNFAPTPFVFHGKRYASLEGFWQMMLYPEN